MSLKFNVRQLPCLSLWKNREAACDGYVTGLEPATNFPNTKSFEKQMGRVVELGPGQSRSFSVALEPLDSAAAVQAAERRSPTCSKVPALRSSPGPIRAGRRQSRRQDPSTLQHAGRNEPLESRLLPENWRTNRLKAGLQRLIPARGQLNPQ